MALLADELGYGDAGSFGIGQLLLLLAGVLLVLAGLLGKRFIAAYHGTAIILLNTIILLALVEPIAIDIGKSSFQTRQAGIENLPYYGDQDWSDDYRQEAGLAQGFAHLKDVHWALVQQEEQPKS